MLKINNVEVDEQELERLVRKATQEMWMWAGVGLALGLLGLLLIFIR